MQGIGIQNVRNTDGVAHGMLLLSKYRNVLNRIGEYVIFKSKQRKLEQQQEKLLSVPVGKTITITIASEYSSSSKRWEARWCKHFVNGAGSTREAAIQAVIPKIVRQKRLEALEERKDYEIEY